MSFFLKVNGQINTFSPYSRFGLGETGNNTFAHNQGMGGTFIALKPDSMFPIMINTGNPASYSLIKFATFEVGGKYTMSQLQTNQTDLTKHNANFNYGTLGFPIRKKSGAVLGIMPLTSVGYNMQTITNEPNIGDVTYSFNGEGGFNKLFIGYGTMPFSGRLNKFKTKTAYKLQDSGYVFNKSSYKFKEFFSELASDLSIGVQGNYLFGSTLNYTDVRFPNSTTFYNSVREKTIRLSDFTGTFGLQTGFTIDSVKSKNSEASRKRVLKEKVKFVFGYYMNLNNSIKASYDLISYNYFLSSTGGAVPKDTIVNIQEEKGRIKLPLEQGIGIGIKKGERLNIVADYSITDWSKFKAFNETNSFKNNSRYSFGLNYVPEKFATGKGTYFRRVQYRFGGYYQTGYLDFDQTTIDTKAVTVGISLPIGIRSGTGLINLGIQAGQTGSLNNNLIKENFIHAHIGLTFNSTYFEDLWFRKFRYD